MNTNDAWVKCSEQLPEEYDYDLWVYSPTHGVVHGVAYSRSQRGFSDDECQFVIKDATHWMSMEIPEPPEAEECEHRVIVDFAEHTTDKRYTCSKCGEKVEYII